MKLSSSLGDKNSLWSDLNTSMRNKRNILALLAILSLSPGCKKDTDNSGGSRPGILSNLIELTIQENDKDEIASYKELLSANETAQKELSALMSTYPALKNVFGDVLSFEELLPILIKESRLHADATSRTGAQGYGQLKADAISDIESFLAKAGVTKKFSPATDHAHNLLFTYLYFSHQVKQVHDYADEVGGEPNKNNEILFATSAYNMGINKRKSLYSAAGKPDSRNEFAEYITSDLMHIKDDPKTQTDKYYNVKEYKNRFGKHDFSQDNTVIYQDKERDIMLTMKKAQESVRYTEIIAALQKHLTREGEIYNTLDYSDKSITPYSAVKDYLAELVKEGKLKDGSNGALIQRVLLDNNISDATDKNKVNQIAINKSVISPFFVLKEFKKYKYTATEYSKENKVYLWSIVNAKLNDRKFINDLEIFDEDIEEGGWDESVSVIRQYLMEAIIRFNTERRSGWKENASQNVWMPEKKYFQDYEELKKITSSEGEQSVEALPDVEDVVSGSNYTNEEYDRLGNQLKEGPTSFPVMKVGNNYVRESIAKHGAKAPKLIVIHGTESPDFNEANTNNLANILAHFYISKAGVIYQFVAAKNTSFATTITYPPEVTSMNHAGEGLKNSHGLIREGSKQKTYESIGIEVETSATSSMTPAQTAALSTLLSGLSTTYRIPQKNIVTHMHVAASKRYGRGRKLDLLGVDWKSLGMIDNYKRLDADVIAGRISPNMKACVNDLKNLRGKSKAEIKRILYGLNVSVKKHRELIKKNPSTPTYNKSDVNAWLTLEELEKKGLL